MFCWLGWLLVLTPLTELDGLASSPRDPLVSGPPDWYQNFLPPHAPLPHPHRF